MKLPRRFESVAKSCSFTVISPLDDNGYTNLSLLASRRRSAVNVNNLNLDSSEDNPCKINENSLPGDENLLKVVPDARLMLDIVENYTFCERAKS